MSINRITIRKIKEPCVNGYYEDSIIIWGDCKDNDCNNSSDFTTCNSCLENRINKSNSVLVKLRVKLGEFQDKNYTKIYYKYQLKNYKGDWQTVESNSSDLTYNSLDEFIIVDTNYNYNVLEEGENMIRILYSFDNVSFKIPKNTLQYKLVKEVEITNYLSFKFQDKDKKILLPQTLIDCSVNNNVLFGGDVKDIIKSVTFKYLYKLSQDSDWEYFTIFDNIILDKTNYLDTVLIENKVSEIASFMREKKSSTLYLKSFARIDYNINNFPSDFVYSNEIKILDSSIKSILYFNKVGIEPHAQKEEKPLVNSFSLALLSESNPEVLNELYSKTNIYFKTDKGTIIESWENFSVDNLNRKLATAFFLLSEKNITNNTKVFASIEVVYKDRSLGSYIFNTNEINIIMNFTYVGEPSSRKCTGDNLGTFIYTKRKKILNGNFEYPFLIENNIQDSNYVEGGVDTNLCKSITPQPSEYSNYYIVIDNMNYEAMNNNEEYSLVSDVYFNFSNLQFNIPTKFTATDIPITPGYPPSPEAMEDMMMRRLSVFYPLLEQSSFIEYSHRRKNSDNYNKIKNIIEFKKKKFNDTENNFNYFLSQQFNNTFGEYGLGNTNFAFESSIIMKTMDTSSRRTSFIININEIEFILNHLKSFYGAKFDKPLFNFTIKNAYYNISDEGNKIDTTPNHNKISTTIRIIKGGKPVKYLKKILLSSGQQPEFVSFDVIDGETVLEKTIQRSYGSLISDKYSSSGLETTAKISYIYKDNQFKIE
jgi:hypothetical protein